MPGGLIGRILSMCHRPHLRAMTGIPSGAGPKSRFVAERHQELELIWAVSLDELEGGSVVRPTALQHQAPRFIVVLQLRCAFDILAVDALDLPGSS